jgi:GT2 family glycosyltransferase
VITVTSREGFWNLMAHNLSKQTYQNFEWVIVDDHKQNREETAKKYAKKYGLNIRYIRGDKSLGAYNRSSGLARANNKGWQSAKGELLVWLQDFILIKPNAIQQLVDVYHSHPNDLIAPTDIYYYCDPADESNREDWWNGKSDVLTVESWRNIRNQNKGLYMTDNAVDFEMNWAAIPRHIVEKVNGWYEFFDDQMGFDNSEFALRALISGHGIWIDDTNVATCLDLGEKYKAAEVNWDYWTRYKELVGKEIPVVADNSLNITI